MPIDNPDLYACEQLLRDLEIRGNSWISYRIVAEFVGFPNAIAGVIADYLKVIKLRDWINPININSNHLSVNPNALLAGVISIGDDNDFLVGNPLAFDYIKQNSERFLSDSDKWFNAPLADWLLTIGIYPTKKSWREIGFCESELAIQWVLNNIPMPDAIGYLSGNPMAIDILRQNLNLLDNEKIWANPAAVDILQAKITAGEEINWDWLSYNKSQWAIDFLQINQSNIKWEWFSENPAIFEAVDHPERTALIKILVRK